MSFKVNAYDPSAAGYAPRIKNKDWERHRSVISHLHAMRIPRKSMLERLRAEHGFTPTLGQLQAKCKEWNLKVYVKEVESAKTIQSMNASPSRSPNGSKQQDWEAASQAFHLAKESGFVDEWAGDYRIHPVTRNDYPNNDRSLPPEYIGGGLLANTVDSHWPVPEEAIQANRMLQAGHYYFSLSAYQQAFSIYRAVYLYQYQHLSTQDPRLISTVLRCACSAVTDHQRNIMHSVLYDIGSAIEVESCDPLLLDCLQSASLSMVSSDATCDIEPLETSKGRATAYFHIFTLSRPASNPADLQVALYEFEHAILTEEHRTKLLQRLLDWCGIAIEHLHHEIDDIFVGHTRCIDEYHRRVSQVLSGYLLSQWNKSYLVHDDQRLSIIQLSKEHRSSLQLDSCSTETIVTLAFIVVDAVRFDPMLTQFNRTQENSPNVWFLDAAKLFKRGIRVLSCLDDRSRCAVFTDSLLERFHTSITYRRKVYEWTASLPAIVDTVGISLAQGGTALPFSADIVSLQPNTTFDYDASAKTTLDEIEDATSAPVSDENMIVAISSMVLGDPSPASECNSIASFINTYHRTLTRKLDSRCKSGQTTPGDLMSLTSSADFKFGVFTNTVNAAEIDSLWHVVIAADSGSLLD